MAASSSGSCKSLTSTHVKVGEVDSADPRDPRPRSSADAGLCACDTFCSALQVGITRERSQLANHGQGGTVTSSAPTRKAEREKLRRDRLNEQMLELAAALGEPDRPKNDKSTILGDAIQTLKELMADVERLRADHDLLVDESQDLGQEKKELHEEGLQLTSKVQHLQGQVCQQMHAMLLWMTADPASMMGVYSVNSATHGTGEAEARATPQVGLSQMQLSFLGPQPMPLVPAVHPALQAYYGCSGRGAPYCPFPFNYTDGASIQAEPFCGQVPQGYPPQAHQIPLMHHLQPVPQAVPYSQAYGPHYHLMTPAVTESWNVMDAGSLRGGSLCHNYQHPDSSSVKPCINEHLANAER
ncbi:hypothetical protein GOP47_0027422 [Adiantum capillus-veneris]|nr:hypothetical protein GOP47_0027422 [Adiantum capillus-veneris]